jgi:DNA-binding FadR family transcriptional regulator
MKMKLEPINNESIVNGVLKRITDSIASGELKPGDKLPTEVEFIEKLGVGRNSVREAIKMLSAMGVLEVKRGNGTYIATKVSPAIFNPLVFSLLLEPKSIDDLYELRTMYESMVLQLAINKASEEDLNSVEKVLDEAKAMYDEGNRDIDAFVSKDMDFHVELLKVTHNPLIERIGKTIVELFPKYIKMSLSQKNGLIRSINNHYKILDVVRNKEKDKVLTITENSLAEWKNKWQE